MKKFRLFISIFFISFNGVSQSFQGSGGLITTFTNPNYKVQGFYFNPQYFIKNNFSIGLNIEFVKSNIFKNDTYQPFMATNYTFNPEITANYYLAGKNVRPYLGFGYGNYTFEHIDIQGGFLLLDSSDEFVPKIGVLLGPINIELALKLLPEIKTIDKKSVLCLKMGFQTDHKKKN